MVNILYDRELFPQTLPPFDLKSESLSVYFPTVPLIIAFPSFLSYPFLHAKGESQATDDARHPEGNLPPHNLGLGEADAEVVDEVLDAVDEVEDEGEPQRELDGALGEEGPGPEGGGEAGAADVPPEQGRGEVEREVDVGCPREGAAGDAGPGRGAEPRLLELVDAEVGGDGAAEALGGEDGVALGRGGAGGRHGGAVRGDVLVSLRLCIVLLWM